LCVCEVTEEKDVRDGNGDCVNDGNRPCLGNVKARETDRDGVADPSRDAHDV